jgi:hypothetical protein
LLAREKSPARAQVEEEEEDEGTVSPTDVVAAVWEGVPPSCAGERRKKVPRAKNAQCPMIQTDTERDRLP